MPARARQADHFASLIHRIQLHDRQVRHVRPRFAELQCTPVELVVQLPDAVGAMGYADKHGRCRRDEGFHIAHSHLERSDLAAHFFQLPDGLFFRAIQRAGRKDGDVGIGMCVRGMQITPQFFYEHASRTADVSHGRIYKAHHEVFIIPIVT